MRLSLLAAEDARVYATALDALREPHADPQTDAQERRDFDLGRALAGAADVPAAIADGCADVTWLAGALAETGDPDLAADAAAAAVLAAAASRAAAHLVEVNLGVRGDDATARGARAAAAAAAETATRSLAR
jgi:formiminotetrahydrofolate cyclodeaminase